MKLLTAIAFLFAAGTAQAQWKTETDLGYVSQSGNATQESAILSTNLAKTSGKNTYNVFGTYINTSGEAAGVDAQLAEAATAGLKYTRTVSKVLGVYSGGLWEKNRFAGFENRYSGDLGLRYDVVKNDSMYFFNETGYRYRKQFEYQPGPGQGDSTESSFARVYLEAGKKISKTSSFKLWVETLYDFDNSDNVEVNFEPSLDVALGEFLSGDKPVRMSLKVAYKGMYDNVPAAANLKKFDSLLTTGLKVVY